MSDRSKPLQDRFLNRVLVKNADKNAEKKSLTIFLVNGVKLTGTVADFDNFSVLLSREGHSQLIYKHAISTIMPNHPVKLSDIEEEDS